MGKITDYSGIFTRYDLLEGKKRTFKKVLKKKNVKLQRVVDCVIGGKISEIKTAVLDALKSNYPQEIIDESLVPAMDEVSRLWEEGVFYLPETLRASDTMQYGIALCEKEIGNSLPRKGVVVTHTAEGDLHDLGQKIVNVLLRAKGYEVIDLGKDVPVEIVIQAVKKYKPIMLTGTAGLTLSAQVFKSISRRLDEEKICLPFICGGGGGVTVDFVTSFKFGVYGKDANEAPLMAEDVIKGSTVEKLRQKYNS